MDLSMNLHSKHSSAQKSAAWYSAPWWHPSEVYNIITSVMYLPVTGASILVRKSPYSFEIDGKVELTFKCSVVYKRKKLGDLCSGRLSWEIVI